ncbi:hypothetical protein EYR40_010194 [Pleurotus pulmonarius]|nr:hypothetical protein EYR40_010194 [Pleurotus pulmonarius]
MISMMISSSLLYVFVLLVAPTSFVHAQRKVLLSDDNGWAVAHIRAPYIENYDVLLVAPADDVSSGLFPPFVPILNQRLLQCQFNTCPGLLDPLGLPLGLFPASGSNSTDSRLNYITGLTVDAVRKGLQDLSPSVFSSLPDLVLVGVHVGNIMGTSIKSSGIVTAAAAAVSQGIPAIVFSGATGSQVSYTTLDSDPNSSTSIAARTYASLVVRLANKLTAPPGPILPPNVGLSVNFPSTTNCATASSVKFVLSRLAADPNANDDSCTNLHLPLESVVLNANGGNSCLASISVWDVSTKEDADPLAQAAVMFKNWIGALWVLSLFPFPSAAQRKVLLTSDSGWATAQIRAQYNALKAANYDVLLDAPADDTTSGLISPVLNLPLLGINARLLPCQFNTCPPLLDLLGIPLGFPVSGSNSTDARLHFLTGHLPDALDDGLNTLSPTIFGSQPNLVIVGPHVGNTFGTAINSSETLGAAIVAINAGVPAIAFSGPTGSPVSFTTLQSDPTSQSALAAQAYTSSMMRLVNTLTLLPPALPAGVGLNVNFPPLANCTSATIPFRLTRFEAKPNQIDLLPCPLSLHIPDEATTVNSGCLASITAFDAETKADIDALTLTLLVTKMLPVLTCPSIL